MTLFTSNKERRLWLWTLAAMAAIYATAGIAQPLAGYLREHELLEISFMLGMVLVIVTIFTQRVKLRPGWSELGVWIGIAAVYLLMFVRIEIPEERTHLIEYGVVAALMYEALSKRLQNGKYVPMPAILTIGATALLGLIDEGIQYFIPNRVFDLRDVGFNVLAGTMAVTASLALAWVNRRRKQYLASKDE